MIQDKWADLTPFVTILAELQVVVCAKYKYKNSDVTIM